MSFIIISAIDFRFSSQVSSENIPPDWGTMHTPKSKALLLIGMLVTSDELINIFPKFGFSNPIIILNRVDFPTPFGPNTPQISPS